jgi:hypothetical protein
MRARLRPTFSLAEQAMSLAGLHYLLNRMGVAAMRGMDRRGVGCIARRAFSIRVRAEDTSLACASMESSAGHTP